MFRSGSEGCAGYFGMELIFPRFSRFFMISILWPITIRAGCLITLRCCWRRQGSDVVADEDEDVEPPHCNKTPEEGSGAAVPERSDGAASAMVDGEESHEDTRDAAMLYF